MIIIGKLSHDKAMLLMERLQASPKFMRLSFHATNCRLTREHVTRMLGKWETIVLHKAERSAA